MPSGYSRHGAMSPIPTTLPLATRSPSRATPTNPAARVTDRGLEPRRPRTAALRQRPHAGTESAPARTQAPRRHQHAVPDLGRHHRRARGLPPLIPHGLTGTPSPDVPGEVHTATCRYSRRTIFEQADTDAVHGPTLGPG
jgi:hypothetical protein